MVADFESSSGRTVVASERSSGWTKKHGTETMLSDPIQVVAKVEK